MLINLLIVFLFLMLVVFAFFSIYYFANQKTAECFVSFCLTILCVVAFVASLPATPKQSYYTAICNETIYNVYEANGNYYLTETNARIILPNCVLIENQND